MLRPRRLPLLGEGGDGGDGARQVPRLRERGSFLERLFLGAGHDSRGLRDLVVMYGPDDLQELVEVHHATSTPVDLRHQLCDELWARGVTNVGADAPDFLARQQLLRTANGAVVQTLELHGLGFHETVREAKMFPKPLEFVKVDRAAAIDIDDLKGFERRLHCRREFELHEHRMQFLEVDLATAILVGLVEHLVQHAQIVFAVTSNEFHEFRTVHRRVLRLLFHELHHLLV
mmetsp:Transcript_104561/g.294644  ORF Transcript_104561/g.294644 Transcript_104561/m.294644 type:complete len:231 (-) Transcript_104561:1040-1732(-)